MIDAGEPLIDSHRERLRHSLQRLAVLGSEQPRLFHEQSADAGAIASEFDRSAAAVLDIGTLPDEAADAVTRVARKLATISRDGADFDADLWTESALRTSEHWAEVRELAAAALAELSQPS